MTKRRAKRKGAKYHIKNQFHPFFFGFSTKEIRSKLIEIIKRALKSYKFRYNNICITKHNFHMTIEPLDNSDISEIMKWIKQMFTQWFNRTFNPNGGSAWKGRFLSRIIENLSDFMKTFENILRLFMRSEAQFTAKYHPIYEEWINNS